MIICKEVLERAAVNETGEARSLAGVHKLVHFVASATPTEQEPGTSCRPEPRTATIAVQHARWCQHLDVWPGAISVCVEPSSAAGPTRLPGKS